MGVPFHIQFIDKNGHTHTVDLPEIYINSDTELDPISSRKDLAKFLFTYTGKMENTIPVFKVELISEWRKKHG